MLGRTGEFQLRSSSGHANAREFSTPLPLWRRSWNRASSAASRVDARLEDQHRDSKDSPDHAFPVRFEQVSLAFDDHVVLREISFDIPAGHMAILLGASGAGKSIILKLTVGLLKPDAGRIWVNGYRIDAMSESELMAVRADIGMVFQEGALFDSLTVGDNVGYRLYEHTDLPPEEVRRRVEEALALVGLAGYIDRMPSELSGGERRRVAIARAMVSRPRLLLFDEPTTGLDPITATTVDDEIIKSRDLAHATSILVTHQLRDAFYIATHEAVREQQSVTIRPIHEQRASDVEFMMLKDGRIHFTGALKDLRASTDPYVRAFLS
jgi:phospholipid/cholesterol/gamma-HCH transport system ATP-binding protein